MTMGGKGMERQVIHRAFLFVYGIYCIKVDLLFLVFSLERLVPLEIQIVVYHNGNSG